MKQQLYLNQVETMNYLKDKAELRGSKFNDGVLSFETARTKVKKRFKLFG